MLAEFKSTPPDLSGTVKNTGIFYKVGRFGFVFCWDGYEWVRTARPWRDIESGKGLTSHDGKHPSG